MECNECGHQMESVSTGVGDHTRTRYSCPECGKHRCVESSQKLVGISDARLPLVKPAA